MVTVKLRLMRRLAVTFCLASFALISGLRDAHAEPGDQQVQPAHAESNSAKPSLFGEILQIAGKQTGKNAAASAEHKGLPDLEAKGASDSASKKAAMAAIPTDKLAPEHRQKVATLLKSISYYRHLPTVTFPVEPDVYQYFLSHPDVAVSVWRAMKISKLQMWQTAKTEFEADTGDGSVGALEMLYADREKCVVACDGLYKSALFSKPIAAKSVLLLQTSFAKQPDGTVHVTHRADLFVNFPSQTIDVVARIFSPLTVKMTDRTFTEISLFLKMMSTAMSRRPDWVEQITEKMDGVPDLRKDQLNALSLRLYTASCARGADPDDDDDDQDDESSRQRRSAASAERKRTGDESAPATRVTSSERSVK